MYYKDPANYPEAVVQGQRERQLDLDARAGNAQSYVAESTMLWQNGHDRDLLNASLLRTAARGIPVYLHVGGISQLLEDGRMSILPQNPFSKKNRSLNSDSNLYIQAAEKMKAGGVEMLMHNPPGFMQKVFPWMSTDHRKFGVIDGKVGWFKDYNFSGGDMDILCYAVRFMHGPTVKALENQIHYSRLVNQDGTVSDNRPAHDMVVHIPGQPYAFLMDRGDKGKSIILKAAIDAAKKDGPAIFATQYPVSGRIGEAIIERSKREQPTLIITADRNDPKIAYENLKKGHISGKSLAAIKWEHDMRDNPYIETVIHRGFVHSKAFLVLTKNGVLGVVGTNNLNELGILAGTQEFAINFTEQSRLASVLYNRHLQDIELQEGATHPFVGTKFESAYIPFHLNSH